MKEKIIDYGKRYGPYVVIILVAIFVLWQYTHQPKPVTYESQIQAETPAGVNEAALNAKIKMQESQLTEAAKQIASLKDKPPITVTHTIVKEVPGVVERERQSAKTDFVIVTDPKHPTKKVDLGDYKETEPVVLNQYNVQAYKKILRQVDYAPKNIDDWSPKEVGFAISRKITNDGKYIGVAVDHEFDNNKTTAKIRYTF